MQCRYCIKNIHRIEGPASNCRPFLRFVRPAGRIYLEAQVLYPRRISLIRRWLKAGVPEDGEVHPNDEGTPQCGSISVLLSNLYLHYVLDLWFERVAIYILT